MKTKRKGTLLIIVGALLLVTVIGIAYAYFVAPLTRTNQTTSVTTGTLRLTFNDVSSSISKTMNFGESVTREFTIENTGSIDAYAKLSFKNLVNSYMLGSLKYTLTYSETGNAGTYKTKLTGMNVPVSASSANYEITDSLLIPANTTYHYQITITLKDSEVIDQTADLNASFYTEFTIENGTELNSASEKTLAALNLTKSSGSPNFTQISPSSDGELEITGDLVCMYNGQKVNSSIKTEASCQRVYEFFTDDGRLTYRDASVESEILDSNAQLEYIGKATWTGEACTYMGEEVPLLYPIAMHVWVNRRLQLLRVPEQACNNIYKASFKGTEMYVSGIRMVGSGEWTVPTQNSGIYSAEDDYGTSYYFRGNVTNNYVKFGKYANDYKVYKNNSREYLTLESCKAQAGSEDCTIDTSLAGADMYWRIVRINGDGSLRLIYDGTSAHANNDESDDRRALTGIPWNDNDYYDAKYVGYMYGGANGEASTSKAQAQTNETNSHIKTALDKWYEKLFLKTVYSTYLSDEIFCNDRSTAMESNLWTTNDTALGYGTNYTVYGVGARGVARLSCPVKNDSFTVGASRTTNKDDLGNGNGALTYPIGLITADELNAAGLILNVSNTQNYLYKNETSLTMTPLVLSDDEMDGGAFIARNRSGKIGLAYVQETADVSPVINLSADAARTLVATTVDGKTIYSLP